MPIKFQPPQLRISLDPLKVDIEILKWYKILLYDIYCHFLIEKIIDNGAFWIQNDTMWIKLSCYIIFSEFLFAFWTFSIKTIPERKETSLKKIQTNKLLINVSGVKYVIFPQFIFEVYQLYLPAIYKFENFSSCKFYRQTRKTPVKIYKI